MIRLLWLFLILDVSISVIFMLASWLGSPSVDVSDLRMRILIELAALAIIEAVRERKA